MKSFNNASKVFLALALLMSQVPSVFGMDGVADGTGDGAAAVVSVVSGAADAPVDVGDDVGGADGVCLYDAKWAEQDQVVQNFKQANKDWWRWNNYMAASALATSVGVLGMAALTAQQLYDNGSTAICSIGAAVGTVLALFTGAYFTYKCSKKVDEHATASSKFYQMNQEIRSCGFDKTVQNCTKDGCTCDRARAATDGLTAKGCNDLIARIEIQQHVLRKEEAATTDDAAAAEAAD